MLLWSKSSSHDTLHFPVSIVGQVILTNAHPGRTCFQSWRFWRGILHFPWRSGGTFLHSCSFHLPCALTLSCNARSPGCTGPLWTRTRLSFYPVPQFFFCLSHFPYVKSMFCWIRIRTLSGVSRIPQFGSLFDGGRGSNGRFKRSSFSALLTFFCLSQLASLFPKIGPCCCVRFLTIIGRGFLAPGILSWLPMIRCGSGRSLLLWCAVGRAESWFKMSALFRREWVVHSPVSEVPLWTGICWFNFKVGKLFHWGHYCPDHCLWPLTRRPFYQAVKFFLS